MKHSNKIIATLLVILQCLCFPKLINSLDSSYKLRIHKMYSCDNSNQTYILKELIISEQSDQHYLSGAVDLLRDVTAANMSVKVESCELSGNECETYGNFNLTEFCKFIFMKGALWSSMVESIKPTPGCPDIKKGSYTIDKATMDMDRLVKVIPVITEHYWKITGKIIDPVGNEFACAAAEVSVKHV